LAIAIILHVRTMPFKSLLVDFSEFFSLCSSFMTMFLGYLTEIRTSETDNYLLIACLFGVNIGYILLVLVLLYQEYKVVSKENEEEKARGDVQEKAKEGLKLLAIEAGRRADEARLLQREAMKLRGECEQLVGPKAKMEKMALVKQYEDKAKELRQEAEQRGFVFGDSDPEEEDGKEMRPRLKALRKSASVAMRGGGVLIDTAGNLDETSPEQNIPHLRLNTAHALPAGWQFATAPGQLHQLPKVILFNQKRIVLGRDPDHCDVLLHGGVQVSRQHCTFLEEQGQWYVHDLGSKYGTFVDGCKITQRTPLRVGASVVFGSPRVTDEGGASLEYHFVAACLTDIHADEGRDKTVVNVVSV